MAIPRSGMARDTVHPFYCPHRDLICPSWQPLLIMDLKAILLHMLIWVRGRKYLCGYGPVDR